MTVLLYLENPIDNFLTSWEIDYLFQDGSKKIYHLKDNYLIAISNMAVILPKKYSHANSSPMSECMLSFLSTYSTAYQFIHFSICKPCDISVNLRGHFQISFSIDITHNINIVQAKLKCEHRVGEINLSQKNSDLFLLWSMKIYNPWGVINCMTFFLL